MGKIPLGIPGFDEVLEGGLLEGHSMLIEGAPGTGKTTLGLQAVYYGAAELNEPGIIVTFEQFPEQLYRDAAQFGWDLRALEEADKLRVISTSPEVFNEQIQEPGGMLDMVMDEIGARRILVDSVTHFERLELETARLREMMNSFLNGFKKRQLTAFLTKELEMEHDSPISFEAYTADAVAILSYEPNPKAMTRTRYLELVKTRGQRHHSGKHLIEFGEHGLVVYPIPRPPVEEIVGNPLERVSTGSPGLDDMLRGGLIRGFCALVVGRPGSGKTTLGLQFLHDGIMHNEPCLFVSLDERIYKIFQMADSFGYLRDFIKSEKFRVLTGPSSGLNPNKLFGEITNSVEELGVKRVVVDGLNTLEANVITEAELRNWIYSLIGFFERRQVTSIFTREVITEAESAVTESLLAGMAMDTLIELTMKQHEDHYEHLITVTKMRTSPCEPYMRRLEITSEGIRVLPRS